MMLFISVLLGLRVVFMTHSTIGDIQNTSAMCNSLGCQIPQEVFAAHSPVLAEFSLEDKSKGFLGVAFGVKQFYLFL